MELQENPNAVLVINSLPDDPTAVEVIAVEPGTGYEIGKETVDFGPNPTWPSPSEQSDLVAEAVKRLWDVMHTHYTGEVLRDA